MKDKTHFKCGHPRRNNSTNGERPQCHKCKTAYNRRRWSDEKIAKALPKQRNARISLVPRMPLPLRADELPDLHADRSYSMFPPKRRAS